jgi:hypothetical protein
MYIQRDHLVTLLNALYDSGVSSIPVKHPCDDIGELLRIELKAAGQATVRFTKGAVTYRDARETIELEYGPRAYNDLPDANSYVRAFVGSGLVPPENADAIAEFVQQHGYPDLEAGHDPVMIGLDTNLMGFRLTEALDIDPVSGSRDGANRRPTMGYALSKGVKKELDWYYNHYDTADLTAAFGEEFARLQNQPAGSNREGFLGLYEFRRLASRRRTDLVPGEDGDVEKGDAAIIQAYREYDQGNRKRVLLFSNDYAFIDNAQDVGLRAQHVTFPVDLPRKTTVPWRGLTTLLYILAVQFGVLQLPKLTLYGVWENKSGKHWQDEALFVDNRSPVVGEALERAISIVERFEEV